MPRGHSKASDSTTRGRAKASVLARWLREPACSSFPDQLVLVLSKLIYIVLKSATGARSAAWHWLTFLRLFKLGRPVTLSFESGLKLTVDMKDPLPYIPMLFEYSSERKVIDLFDPQPGDVVLDCGAGIGLYALIAAQRVGGSGHVIAVDANPESLRYLTRNMKMNHCKNVKVIDTGAWDSETSLDLGIRYTYAAASVVYRDGVERKIRIRGRTLDNILREEGFGRLDWMVVDVEGAELQALSGARELLRIYRPAVIVEIHGQEMIRPIVHLLRNMGYTGSFVQGRKTSGAKMMPLMTVHCLFRTDLNPA